MIAILIRPLQEDDWAPFRALRLRALQSEPGVFATAYAEAAARPESQWRWTVSGADHQAFGLFDGAALIGITAIFRDSEDPSGATAMLAMSFIEPAYRGRGLSQLFYDARLAWARAHGGFRRIVVSHRASNEASRRANQRHGFTLTGSAPRTWPDGVTEDEISYELLL
ncbi:MAG: GNAT family N-acetyltransferase [Hyphomonadaceae bacterium]|nr:GNAT family N-acetyltransferase [Hyphomonadaceae bacterium]